MIFETKNLHNPEGLNVLLVGEGKNVEYILSSKFLRKLYTTSKQNFEGVLNINFNTFKELAKKCKSLQIDLVIVEEERWIKEGISDVLRNNFVNCFAANAKWAELGISNTYARKILEKYKVNIPPTTLLPTDFPLIVKGNGILRRADSVQDVIKIREEVFLKSPVIAQNLYLEKYLDGEKYIVISIYDGKHLVTFPCKGISEEILRDYSSKIENMLIKEKADFVGFINSEVVLFEQKLYNTGFRFEFLRPAIDLDILYVLWLSVFQKSNEIVF